MSYPTGLQDLPTAKLKAELIRRAEANRDGLCDYCGRTRGSFPFCKHPDRHGPIDSVPAEIGDHVDEYLEWLRTNANQYVDEGGSSWDDLPFDIAHNAIAETLRWIEKTGHRLQDVTALKIGQLADVIDADGEWL